MADRTVQLIDAIASLYDSAIDPTHWDTFIEKMSDIVDGNTGVLVLNPNGTPSQQLHQLEGDTFANRGFEVVAKYRNFPPEALKQYMENFFLGGDIWYQLIYSQRLMNQAFIGTDLISMEELRSTRFFKEVFNVNENEYIVGAVLEPSSTGITSFSLSREGKKGNFTSEDRDIFQLLVPHIQRARTIYSHYHELKVREQQLKEALNASLSAILLLDSRGGLIFANRLAEEILREGDGFEYRAGVVSLSQDALQSDFEYLVRQCVLTSQRESLFAGGGFHVFRPSEKPFYRMVVTPLNMKSEYKRLDPLAAVAVFIYDTTQLRVPSGDLLQSMFELTEAEVRVAHLFYQCYSLQQIADELGVKVTTIRSQFYRVFEKTRTQSQAELMKLLDQLPHATLSADDSPL